MARNSSFVSLSLLAETFHSENVALPAGLIITLILIERSTSMVELGFSFGVFRLTFQLKTDFMTYK